MQEKGSTSVIVAAAIALAIGGAGGYAISQANSDDTIQSAKVSEENPRVDTAAADLRTNLTASLTEHVDLAAPALRAVFDSDESLDGIVAALDANSIEIAETVDSAYPGTRDDFLGLWRDHIGFFVDYTTAAKADDQAAMDEALANLDGYTDQAATFFSDANPNLPKDALAEGLSMHVSQVIEVVNAYGAGNFEESYALQREASDHMVMTAATLSGGIVTQFPENF